MSAITKGPWRLLADEQIMGRPVSGRWVIEADGAYICLDPEWDHECYEESLANARLIASAPELLKALTDLLVRAKDELIDPIDVWEVEMAERAIAKAKGEQP